MTGYFNNEQANKEAFSGDWFRTGDVVVTDEDGDIFIVDRIKDMIKVKGYQVSPTELEDEMVESLLVSSWLLKEERVTGLLAQPLSRLDMEALLVLVGLRS